MHIQRIAAFCDGDTGGNPAGVVIGQALPDAAAMQALAAEIGYSETAFAAPEGEAWRVRYFAPAVEVNFCGHATIALGAALSLARGDGVFRLRLNHASITVEGRRRGDGITAALQSPPTRSHAVAPALLEEACALFGLAPDDLDPRIPPAMAHAGADHLILALCGRERLAGIFYDFNAGLRLALQNGIGTFSLVHAESDRLFHARNPFPLGGVMEDPATGAAAAALAGYLRDIGWPMGDGIEISQGVDMGVPSRLFAQAGAEPGSSIRVMGQARII